MLLTNRQEDVVYVHCRFRWRLHEQQPVLVGVLLCLLKLDDTQIWQIGFVASQCDYDVWRSLRKCTQRVIERAFLLFENMWFISLVVAILSPRSWPAENCPDSGCRTRRLLPALHDSTSALSCDICEYTNESVQHMHTTIDNTQNDSPFLSGRVPNLEFNGCIVDAHRLR